MFLLCDLYSSQNYCTDLCFCGCPNFYSLQLKNSAFLLFPTLPIVYCGAYKMNKDILEP